MYESSHSSFESRQLAPLDIQAIYSLKAEIHRLNLQLETQTGVHSSASDHAWRTVRQTFWVQIAVGFALGVSVATTLIGG